MAYRYDKALNKEDITLPENATIGEITYEVQVNNEPGEAAGTYNPRRLNAGEPLTLSDTLSTSWS